MNHVLNWNGKDLPSELRKLMPGRYVVAAVDVPELTAEEEDGIRLGLAQIDRGEAVPAADVYARLDAVIASKTKPRRRVR